MKTDVIDTIPISEVKDTIKNNIGQSIVIKEFNRQRRQINEYTGKIVNVYDSVFLVDVSLNKYHINKSFSYVDFSIGDMVYRIGDNT